MAADRRRKELRTVPRPWDKKVDAGIGAPGLDVNLDTGVVKAVGWKAMLAHAQTRGAVVLGESPNG